MANRYQEDLRRNLLRILQDDGVEIADQLYSALRLLTRYRTLQIANTLLRLGGDRVRSGPFAGLAMPSTAAEGCLAPKLLGTYESELHPVIEQVVARGYRTIVNIGSADGYYAVGLARRLPQAMVLAYDIDENAQAATRRLADSHGVGDRVTVAGEFRITDFEDLDPASTFVFCDI